MTIIQRIKNLLLGKKETTETPENYCPNCWGRQEYEGQLLEAIRNEKIDLNNIDQKKGWIDAYATKHFEGIRLKNTDKDDTVVCSGCEVSYKKA